VQALRIHDLLDLHRRERGDAEAVVDENLRLSYAELAQEVDRCAAALLTAGIGRGDRVATLTPPSHEFWITYLATVSIGAIWLGLNPRYKERDYDYLLKDATPRLVFTRSPYDGRQYDRELMALSPSVRYVSFGSPADGAESFEQFVSGAAACSAEALKAAREAVLPGDVAVIVYTSGTTGKPKGAMLSHLAIARLAVINANWMGTGLRKTIMPAPINHVGGLNNVCMNVFAYGGCIVFFHRVDPVALMQLTFTEKPSYLVASPTAFRMLLDAPGFQVEMLSDYELIVFGGAKATRALIEPFYKLKARLVGVYGQTETTGIVTRTDDEAPLEAVAETLGRALPGVELRVVDLTTLASCRIGEVGELQVHGDVVMSGYYGKPDATREAMTADGWLRTGDLCLTRADGNVEYVDRIKEMFKSGGYNVYPVEIEQAICEHPDIMAASVLKVPDRKFDEVGFAFVVVRPGAALDAAQLRSFLSERIANYKIPKQIRFLDALPLLPNSKVDRQVLRQQLPSSTDVE
jgi:acyl-CoA synthetase (AMP-forming)/AMP-acid ligase II